MKPMPLICANWKMNLTASESTGWASQFVERLAPHRERLGVDFEVAIAPAHPVLDRLGAGLAGSGVLLAAQNVHADEAGAFTGEVAVSMLEDLGCRYALIGHSERRQLFGEQDGEIASKAIRLLDSTVRPILCVGETLDEREHGATLEVVQKQIEAVLTATDGLDASLVVAYEPVWAIGTGRTATPEIAQDVHAAIRQTLNTHLGDATGAQVRILYGGSVKPSNARELLSQPDINGALVGGASLDPGAFSEIALACLA